MPSTSPPPRPPGSNYREIYALVCSMLPPSPDDTPDTRAARERGAMDAVTALNPADAFEARLAAPAPPEGGREGPRPPPHPRRRLRGPPRRPDRRHGRPRGRQPALGRP